MTSQQIKFENHLINYHQFGDGEAIILAFHGFGLTGQSFLPLAQSLKDEYTIYSFDLFFHGKSHWDITEKQLTKNQWGSFIEFFCNKNSINRFSILAFSLGGKFALSALEFMPDRIDRIILLAPDGIQTQLWYNLATYPLVFQNYFKSIIVRPKRFHTLLSTLNSLGLVDKGISKFALSQMNSIKKRRRVYYSWVVFKNLTINLKNIASLINKNEIKVDMFLGKYDKIITERGMHKLLSDLNSYNLEILDCGHNNLIEHTADFLNQNK